MSRITGMPGVFFFLVSECYLAFQTNSELIRLFLERPDQKRSRQPHATDAGTTSTTFIRAISSCISGLVFSNFFHRSPDAVVFPANVDEVSQVARYCYNKNVRLLLVMCFMLN